MSDHPPQKQDEKTKRQAQPSLPFGTSSFAALVMLALIAVISALSNKKTSYAELLVTNLIIFGATYFLEIALARPPKAKLCTQDVIYDKLEMLHPGNEEQLNADLKLRTGIDPVRVDVKKIDLQKGSASISVRYNAEGQL